MHNDTWFSIPIKAVSDWYNYAIHARFQKREYTKGFQMIALAGVYLPTRIVAKTLERKFWPEGIESKLR